MVEHATENRSVGSSILSPATISFSLVDAFVVTRISRPARRVSHRGLPMIALIHIKKTAGKTLKHIMRCAYGAAHCDVKRWSDDADVFSAADLQRLMRINPWLASIAGHSVRSTSDIDQGVADLRFYTFLRDPIKRTVSQYQYSVAQGRCREGEFERFITRDTYRNVQTTTIAGIADADAAIAEIEARIAFVGLMERFDESLALMQDALALPLFTPLARRVNAAGDQRIRDALIGDAAAMQAVHDANLEDQKVFDYVLREVYPRQQKAATRVSVGADGTASAGQATRQYNRRFFTNGLYRYTVYKPAVALWRGLG